MADVQIKYPWAWMAVFLLIIPAAGLMISDDPTRVRWGIALMMVPLLMTSVVLAVFYLRSRRD